MMWFVVGICFQIIASLSAETNEILQHLMSHEFSPTCNLLTCNGYESINLIKRLSARFQRFVVVHRADKALMTFLHEPQSFVLDLRCPEAATILRQADDLHMFGKPFQWVLIGDGTTGGVTPKAENFSETVESWFWPFLETLNILVDSDVRVLEGGSDGKITVTGAYKIRDILVKEPLAEWTPGGNFIVLNSKSIATRRWNLRGVTIPSTTVITHPESLQHLEDLVDKQTDTATKLTYNVVNLYGDLLNATMKYKVQKEWGVLINGSWTGMVGDLERKEIEVGAAPLFPQKNRMHLLEYYAEATPSRLNFIFLSPPLSYSRNIFAMPFDTVVWACCFFTVAFSCFFLFTALNFEKTQMKDAKISFSEILILNIGAICLQGTVAETKNLPGRILTLFLYLSYMFLYISYSASIVAILHSSDTSIQTLNDFLKSPLRAGAEDVVYSRHYFKNAEGEVRKAIYNKKIIPKGEPPHFLPVTDGIREVRKGFYGYHVELNLGYLEIEKTFTEEEKCGLQELKEAFLTFAAPLTVMRKRTPYAEMFKIGMRMFNERGVKNRFVRRYYTKKPICVSKASRFVSVGITDSYYAFMLLGGGILTSFSIMILEIAFHKYLKKRKERIRLRNNDLIPDNEFLN